MFSITTKEVRWFFKGNFPPKLYDWLSKRGGIFEAQESRTDAYNLLPGNTQLGIKMREGRMEIKKKLSGHEIDLGGTISGKMETWIKWSGKIDDEPGNMGELINNTSHWIKIEKKRYLQKFEITPSYQLIPYPSQGFPKAGASIELASLSTENQQWWTFGVESYGVSKINIQSLKGLYSEMLGSIPFEEFNTLDSIGYPAWINGIKKPLK